MCAPHHKVADRAVGLLDVLQVVVMAAKVAGESSTGEIQFYETAP